MLARREVALVLGLAAVTALLAVAPGLNTPIARLAAYERDGPEPLYDAPQIDPAAIRLAAELVPDRTAYAVYAPPANPVLAGNLKAAAQLFFLPALPVHDPVEADWILSYGGLHLLPAGVRPTRVHRLTPELALVETRR